MFSFLKEKLKAAVSKLSGKSEEKKEVIAEPSIENPVITQEREITSHDIQKKVIHEEIKEQEHKEEKKKELFVEPLHDKKKEEIIHKRIPLKEEIPNKEDVQEIIPEKKGFFESIKEKITTTTISEKEFSEYFDDLEIALLENNVAVEVIDRLKGDLENVLVHSSVKRGQVEEMIEDTLKKSLDSILQPEKIDFLSRVRSKKPFIICFVGINGSGKTTTIAKVARLLQKNDISCVIAAADTFRAAAIDQLEYHAQKLGIKMIKHDYGADPAAVAFDAVHHAEAKNIDVVLIDTAGRLHSNSNLVEEMKKIIRVAKPDLKIFVGESITGNDCIEQAQTFHQAIGIDGIILSKVDVDEKGGTAVSVGYVIGKPILFLGTGQEYDDLQMFEPSVVMKGLGLA